jgi:hypothetical protein
MAGWVPPSGGSAAPAPGPGPIVGWAAPSDDDDLGVGASIRAGWALTRAHLVPLAAVTAIPMLIWTLLLVPLWVRTAEMFDRWIQFMGHIDWARYRSDPDAFQRDMSAAFAPSTDYAVLSAVFGGVGIVVAIVGAAAVTSATLAAADGRRVSVADSFTAVAAHAGAIVLPAVVLGIAVAAITLPLGLSQASFVSAGASPSGSAFSVVISLVTFVVWIAVIVLGVRWSLAFQAILGEDLGLRAGLSRSAVLTRGIRLRIFLTLIAIGLLVGFLATIPAFIVAVFVGVATASIGPAVAAYTILIIMASLVSVPLLVAILTVIYRRRAAAPAAAVARAGSATIG